MAQDTKYLQNRNGNWWIDCRIPKNSGIYIPGNRLRVSLHTTSYAVARRIRDQTIVPLMATASKHACLTELVRQLCAASDTNRAAIAKLAAAADVQQIAGIRSAVFDAVPLQSLCDQYAQYLEDNNANSAGTTAKYTGSLQVWLHMLGPDTDAQTITKENLVAARNQLVTMPRSYFIRQPSNRNKTPGPKEATLSGATIKNHLLVLAKVYDWAIADGILTCTNPARKIVVEVGKTKHKKCPTTAEADKLCALPKISTAIGQHEWDTIPTIARYTGARFEEVVGIYADDIVIKDGVRCISIHDGNHSLKTSTSTRLIPIAAIITDKITAALEKNPTGRLFPQVGDSKKTAKLGVTYNTKFNIAAKTVAPDLSFHCFRVYANTRMIEAGVNPTDIKRIIGHKDTSTQSAYTSRDLRRYQQAIDAIAAREIEESKNI